MRDWIIIAPQERPTLVDITRAVAKHFVVPRATLQSESRYRKHAWPRHVAYWLALLDRTRSLPVVGRYFHRDHTTIMYGRNHVLRAISENEPLGLAAIEIARQLGLPLTHILTPVENIAVGRMTDTLQGRHR
jgi:chromosomal replication initiation ATPase DnaA